MKKTVTLLMALLPLLLVPAITAAQKLEPGKWTGTVAPPDGSVNDVTYDVALRGDTIAISVNAGQHGVHRFNDVKLDNNRLTFWFEPGPRVECTLQRRDDGAFQGSCTDPQGGIAQMLMLPPKKQ